jgi:DNA helicase-2/ATP-dependent DNA helicase PcrA
VPPRRILAVTFTNKAAGEMKERIRRLLGEEPAGMWVGTFHSMGARILRIHAPLVGWPQTFTIYDQDQSLRQIKSAQEEVGVDSKRWNPKVFRAQVSGAKNQLVTPQEFLEENGESFDLVTRHVARIYPVYQEALRSHDAFDFDDLLMKPVQLLEANPEVLGTFRRRFSFLLVDEYQDTNRAQFRLLELLAGEEANLMVVGDDDQSIYAWRGADIRNILDFESAFPSARVVRLEQNYRSTERILEAANQVIRHNVERKGKTLFTDRVGGEPLTVTETLDETDEARWIAGEIRTVMEEDHGREFADFAVLYRTNAQARALEDAFRREGLPYQVVGGVRFYERREIQDVLGYLRLVSNPRDGVAFDRVVNYPRRGIGATSLGRLRAWAREEDVTLLEAARRAEEVPKLPGRATRSLLAFADLVQRFSVRASQVSVGAFLEELIEELDLLSELRNEGPDGDDRAENVKELIAGAMDFDAELLEEEELPEDRFTELDLFLQRVALVAEVDLHDPGADTVTLMTLHNAKGLEFPHVFIAGLEDGLFPLGRAYDDPSALEEERRLFYVGITRAREKLYLTHARRRRRAGEYMHGRLSPFVEAVDPRLLDSRLSPGVRKERTGGAGRGFGRGFGAGGGREGRGAGEVLAQEPALPAGSSDEGFPEEDLNQDRPHFARGERVSHPTFGSGTVLTISGFGPDLKVTVKFDSVGTKKLLARYADLEKDYF